MIISESVRGRILHIIAGAVRVIVGILWVIEGRTKYQAGFGATDIQLVVESTQSNPRVPELYKVFTENILGQTSGFFGVAIPLLETALGLLLILGIFSLPAACVSIGLLTMYWSADQLIGQYPVMILLSASLLLTPMAMTHYSASSLLLKWKSSLGTTGRRVT